MIFKQIILAKLNNSMKYGYKYGKPPYYCPKQRFYEGSDIFEEDIESLKIERVEAIKIYNVFQEELLCNLNEKEKDIIDCNIEFGYLDPIDNDENLKTIYMFEKFRNFNDYEFIIPTKFGELIIILSSKNNSNDLATYDEINKKINLYFMYSKNINLKEIWSIINNQSKIIHEITHYIDDVSNKLKIKNDDYVSPEIYFNDPAEIKAFTHQIIEWISHFVFKHHNNFNKQDLKSKEFIEKMINRYLVNIKPNVGDLDLLTFRMFFIHLSFTNKMKVIDEIRQYFLETLFNDKNKKESINSENFTYSDLRKLWKVNKYLLNYKEKRNV